MAERDGLQPGEPVAAGEDGRRLVKHARYYWLMLAESHLTGRLFASMVRRIGALQVATGSQEGDDTSEIRQTRTRGRKGVMEITEKKQLPDFEFFRRGGIGIWRAKRRPQEKKFPKHCNSEVKDRRPVINPTESRRQNGNPGQFQRTSNSVLTVCLKNEGNRKLDLRGLPELARMRQERQCSGR